jgi:hypothetical protein
MATISGATRGAHYFTLDRQLISGRIYRNKLGADEAVPAAAWKLWRMQTFDAYNTRHSMGFYLEQQLFSLRNMLMLLKPSSWLNSKRLEEGKFK